MPITVVSTNISRSLPGVNNFERSLLSFFSSATSNFTNSSTPTTFAFGSSLNEIAADAGIPYSLAYSGTKPYSGTVNFANSQSGRTFQAQVFIYSGSVEQGRTAFTSSISAAGAGSYNWSVPAIDLGFVDDSDIVVYVIAIRAPSPATCALGIGNNRTRILLPTSALRSRTAFSRVVEATESSINTPANLLNQVPLSLYDPFGFGDIKTRTGNVISIPSSGILHSIVADCAMSTTAASVDAVARVYEWDSIGNTVSTLVATSNVYNQSSLPSSLQPHEFVFSDNQRVFLNSANQYVTAIECVGDPLIATELYVGQQNTAAMREPTSQKYVESSSGVSPVTWFVNFETGPNSTALRLAPATGLIKPVRTASGFGLGTETATKNIVKLRTATGFGLGTETAVRLIIDNATALGLGYGTETATSLVVSSRTASGSGLGTETATSLVVSSRTASGSGLGTETAVRSITDSVTASGLGVGSQTTVGNFKRVRTATGSGSGNSTATRNIIKSSAATGFGVGTSIALKQNKKFRTANGFAIGISVSVNVVKKIKTATGFGIGVSSNEEQIYYVGIKGSYWGTNALISRND